MGSSSRSYCGSKPYDESKPDWTAGGLDGDTPDGSDAGDERKEFVADTKMYATKEEYQQMLDNKEKYKHLMPTPTWSEEAPDGKEKYKHLAPKSPERKSSPRHVSLGNGTPPMTAGAFVQAKPRRKLHRRFRCPI